MKNTSTAVSPSRLTDDRRPRRDDGGHNYHPLRSSLLILLALLLIAGTAGAREVQKVGTSSLQMLKISSSVRAIGLADAYCAVSDDIQALFWNPGGLVNIEGTSVIFNHINMPANIQFNSFAAVKNMDHWGILGVHVLSLNTDDMIVRTIYKPEGTGENFMAYDIVGGVTWAQKLTDRFSFGVNFRLVSTGIDDVTYSSILGDIGTIYQTALRTLKIGFSVQNFGPDIDYDGEYLDYLDKGRRNREEPLSDDFGAAPPPTIYRIGLAANFFEMTGFEAPPGIDGLMSLEMSHPNDNRERINFGVEFTYLHMISVRGGHKLKYKNQFGYDEERWSAGFGLRIPIADNQVVTFDYGYLGMGHIAEASDGFMDSPHRFSLGLNF